MNVNEITGSASFRKLNPSLFTGLGLPDSADDTGKTSKSKRSSRNGALGSGKVQKAVSPRFFVRTTSYRVRLLDEDNLISKWHTDLARYCGFLPSDAPGTARIVTTQEKVGSKEEERVEVQISLIPQP